jgi:FkbM family methyltransferase
MGDTTCRRRRLRKVAHSHEPTRDGCGRITYDERTVTRPSQTGQGHMRSRQARLLTGLSRVLTADPLGRATVPFVRRLARRWPSRRVVTTSAYYFGAAMSKRRERRVGRLLTGAQMELNLEDYAHHHIYFFGTYELPTTRFLRRVVEPGWTVLDVGANAGYYCLLIHDLTRGHAQIHAFEPNPAMADLLDRSVRLNTAKHLITVVRAGAGAENGQLELHLSPERTNTGRSTFLKGTFPEADVITVPVVRLDQYCFDRRISPDLVKIDVEGFESK